MTFYRAWVVAVYCVAILLACGCTTTLSMREVGHAVVQSEPVHGVVHPYAGLEPRTEHGPLVAIYVATATELETLAPAKTHHLYFNLLPCTQQSPAPTLYSGRVFAAAIGDQTDLAKPGDGQHLYKVHVPLDFNRIVAHAKGYGALDVPAYLRIARQDGMCVRIGGGKMFSSVLFSNLVPVPLTLHNDSLVLRGDAAAP